MRVFPVVALLGLLILSGFTMGASGRDDRFGDCPRGHSCESTPEGDPFPPQMVTGHTAYASFRVVVDHNATAGGGGEEEGAAYAFPSAPVERVEKALRDGPFGPHPASIQEGGNLVQAECVAWTNGDNLEVRPPDAPGRDGAVAENHFFSDEDDDNGAFQDYDPVRELESCIPGSGGTAYPPHVGRPTDFASLAGYFELHVPATPWSPNHTSYGTYAVVVEAGDCHPQTGQEFRYRGHLDFVDPNDFYHEVQEYDYVCGGLTERSGPAGNHVPTGRGTVGRLTSDAVKALFPYTGTDTASWEGCKAYHTPTETIQPGIDPGSVDPDDPTNSTTPRISPYLNLSANYFDLGHKCNGSIQDLFTERLWITPVHAPVVDPTIQARYTFALAFDTCSGRNIQEGWDTRGSEWEQDALDWLLDQFSLNEPLMDVCFDGSSFSFDDTGRGRTTHTGPPASEEEVMRGNAYNYHPGTPGFGMHRNDCRHNWVDWPWNSYPGRHEAERGPLGLLGDEGSRYTIGEDCFPEDHKTAPIDVYVFDFDPTGLFAFHSNGLTGMNTYTGPKLVTGPNWIPGQ